MALSPPTNGSTPPKPGSREEAAQDGFLREVDEALREEQLVNAFKRYARPVGAAIALGLAGLGGYLYWDNTQKTEAAQWSERMIVAQDRLEAGQIDPAVKDLELIAREAGGGNRATALLLLAGLTAQQGKTAEAAQKFAAIAGDAQVPQALRDLALVRQTALQFDTLKPEEVVARLKPLAVPGKPWFGTAGELVGMAYLEQGKADLAGALFAQIGKDPAVPDSLRSRLRQVAGGLGFDAGVDDAALAGGEAGAAADPSAAASQ